MLQTPSRSTQKPFIRYPVDSLVSAFVRKFPRDVEIGPVLSRDILKDFGRPEEQESILELRKQAISAWLSQLPKEDSFVDATKWSTSQTLTNIAIYSNRQTNEDQNEILVSQGFEECKEDTKKGKLQPLEFQSPMKLKHDSRQVQSVRNHTELDSNSSILDPEFDQQIKSESSCKSIKLDLQRLTQNTPHIDHLTNHRNQHSSEDLFHVKYKASTLKFQPSTDKSSCTQSMIQSKAPKGDWWVPNVCFAASEEAMDDSSPHLVFQAEDSILPELPDRIQQRLMRGHRPNLRLPTRRHLIKRMKEALNRQESKKSDLPCALECPFDLRRMLDLPSKDSKANLSIAPEMQVMEYNAPHSLDGLSDFECYSGHLFSSLTFNQETAFHFCQNWIFDKFLCLLTGGSKSWSGNPPH